MADRPCRIFWFSRRPSRGLDFISDLWRTMFSRDAAAERDQARSPLGRG